MLFHRALTLGTLASVSASSMTSSWYSDPRCTSWTAAAPVIASACAATFPVLRTQRQRQRRPEPLSAGAQEVAGDLAEERVLGPNRGLEPTFDAHQVIAGRATGHRGST